LHGATRRFSARSTKGELLLGDMESGQTRELSFGSVDWMRWSPNGDQLLFSSDKVRIWDGERCRVISETAVAYGAWSPRGDRVVLAHEGEITSHNATTGDLLARGTVEDMVQDVAFAPDGLSIAVACFYRNVFVLDGESLAVTARLAGHEDLVWQVTWTGQGQLISTSNDMTVRVWDRQAHIAPDVYLAGVQDQVWVPTSGDPVPDGRAKAVTMPGDAGIVVVGDRIRVLPLGNPAVLKGHVTYAYHLAFSPDGSMLASSAFRQSEVRVWDVNLGKLHRKVAAAAPPPSAADAPLVTFSPDGRRLVTMTGDAMHVWDVDSCAELPTRSVSQKPWEALYEELGDRRVGFFFPGGAAISADGVMAAGARGKVVEVFRRATTTLPSVWADPRGLGDELVCRLVGHTGHVFSVAFSPDGSRIATGSNDTTVCIWDAQTGERLLVLNGHEQYVMDVAWSPDGKLLASASGDTTVRLWDSLPLHERRAIGRR
jgi:WD40 repeat protein